jgi:NTE family protein
MRGLILLLATVGPVTAVGQDCPRATTALVLSGGGAKGLAHIGVIAALDSLGIRPDLVVGTSIGAIVGGLYASGYSARQIDSLARDLPVAEIVRPFRVTSPHAWDRRLPLLFLVRGRTGFAFQTGAVTENQPNARINAAMLRGNLLARGRFDRLPIPFRAIATDLRDRSTVVLTEGDLARAVRASSAIPLVFPPVLAAGAVLVDGGLSANIPVAEARAAGAERVIVSDVTEHLEDSLDVESPLALADQLLGFLFRQPAAGLSSADLMIRPDVQRFRSLDFSRESVREILRRGRIAADTTLGRARCLPRRPPPSVPSPPSTLIGWSVAGGSAADSILIGRMLELSAPKPLDPARLNRRLIDLAEAEALRGIWLNPTGTSDSIRFTIEPIPAPTMVGGLGVGYDHELGGKAWGGLFDRRVLGTTLEAGLLLSLGRLEREMVGTAVWHSDAAWSLVTQLTTMRLRTERIRRFDTRGRELRQVGTEEASVETGIEFRADRAWRIRLGATVAAWGSDSTRGDGGVGGSVRATRNWRDGPEVTGDLSLNTAFRAVRVLVGWPLGSGPWSVRPGLRLNWGDDLPLQRTFALGGDQGFPGLHLGERRGSREASASLRLGYAIARPIELRLLLAGGRTWSAGTLGDDWLGGARLGLGTETPIGPVDLAYGVATNGRGAMYIRIGAWF